MPPDTHSSSSKAGEGQRPGTVVGKFVVGAEIGRGSFATVYKGYRASNRGVVAIKAVSRQKLTGKLLENLESEINILKAVQHRNVVSMEECFKDDTSIYLVMEFCSGSDLSIYIKNRGKIPTLDIVPKGERPHGSKTFWDHPPAGGLDEKITRSFLGQLAEALRFLRTLNLIHRDLKPQNLLLRPSTADEVADGHPYGIPVLKVADFGFARILPAAAMAETLCGSPLYMAPEILRYEKYDAKADLWSVGAVLFEMAVGRPPFRASNHVELLRKIERGEDRIKFPDESRSHTEEGALPVPDDIKSLIRALLKRHPTVRMNFDAFFACGVWERHMIESKITEGSTSSLEVSTDSSAAYDESDRIRDLMESTESERETPRHAPQPLAADPALNPRPARPTGDVRTRSSAVTPQPAYVKPTRRSEPKYYVGDAAPAPPVVSQAALPSTRPIQTPVQRRSSAREPASLEEPQPVTPSGVITALPASRSRGVGEGSPLASAPPMTMDSTGKDESALEADDSMVAKDYVVVEKRTVEVNALADELDQASRRPNLSLGRRPSSRTSVVTRPVSSFRPSPASSPNNQQMVPMSYSPPFGLSSTPPFAMPPVSRQASGTPLQLSRPPSITQNLNIFPPTQLYEAAARFGSSPSSLQTGALARALTNTAIRIIGNSANAATTAIARATSTSQRRPTIVRTGDIDSAEEDLLQTVEDVARKAFVLFELADSKLQGWQSLATNPPTGLTGASPRRKSSSSSMNSEVLILRQQESLAGEAVVLLYKALAFIVRGTNKIQRYWKDKAEMSEYQTSKELNDMVQWLRARFNECFEKAEWAKGKCAEDLPFIDGLVHDKAKDCSRLAALAELKHDFPHAESGYETSLWLFQALLDDIMHEPGRMREEDRISYEKHIAPVKVRLEALKKKMQLAQTPT